MTNNKDYITNFKQIFFNLGSEGHHDYLNVILSGKVSSGKTTLLNCLLKDLYSEIKYSRSTGSISMYVHNPNNASDSINTYTQNHNINKEFVQHKDNEQFNINFNYFQVNTSNNFIINNKINLIDIPGVDDLNDSIDKQVYEFIKQNQQLLDIMIIVIDTNDGLNTQSGKKKITELIKSINPQTPILFVFNKIDIFTINKEELIELYNTNIQELENHMITKNFTNKYNICFVSSLAEYIAEMKLNNKTDRLNETELKRNFDHSDSNFEELYDKLQDLISYIKTEYDPIELKRIRFYAQNTSSDNIKKFINIIHYYEHISDSDLDYITKSIYDTIINKTKKYTLEDCNIVQKEINELNEYISSIYKSDNLLDTIPYVINKLMISLSEFNNNNIIKSLNSKIKKDGFYQVCNTITQMIRDNNFNNYNSNNLLLSFMKKFNRHIKEEYIENNHIKVDLVITSETNEETEEDDNISDTSSYIETTYVDIFSSHSEHYNFIIKLGESIKQDNNMSEQILKEYVNTIITSNLLCDTISLDCKFTYYKDITQSKTYKHIYKYLFLTYLNNFNNNNVVFKRFKNLQLLQAINGDTNSNITIEPIYLLDFNHDDIDIYFRYFDIIKKLIDYSPINNLI